MNHLDPIVELLGICLVGAFIVGKVAHRLRVPKVTGFIVLGIILGPTGFGLFTDEVAHQLEYLSDIALGLILFNIGGEFHQDLLKKIGWKMVKYGLVYCCFVSVIVSSICFLGSQVLGFTLLESVFFGGFLGIVAMTAAPPTTLLVISEYHSKGKLTDHIIVILAIGTVFAIILSQLALIVFELTGVTPSLSDQSSGIKVLMLIWSIVGSIMIGTLLGLGLSYLEQLERSSSEILLAVVCAILVGSSLSYYLHLEPLLVSIFLGFSLVNFSHSGMDIHKNIKGVGLSMYALFFIFAGSHIDLRDISTIGLFGVLYAVARITGVVCSSILATKVLKSTEVVGGLVGMGLLSHAGAALGLVEKISGMEEYGIYVTKTISAVVSSIFLFEIIGPILLRVALIKAREIKVADILGDASSGSFMSLPDMMLNFFENIGIIKHQQLSDTDRITKLIQRKIYAVDASASFSEVVKYIDSHHFPIYPVVDKDFKYEGLVDLAELKNVMFDYYLSKFVNARDLVGLKYFVSEDARLQDCLELFQQSQMETLPVIKIETGKLVGFLSHKTVVIALGKEPETNSKLIE